MAYKARANSKKWKVKYSISNKIVEHRFGTLFITISAILFSSRGSEASIARNAILTGIILGCTILLIQNMISLKRRRISRGIIPGMVLQILTVIAFGFVLINEA